MSTVNWHNFASSRINSNIPASSKIFFPLKYQVFKLDSYVQLVVVFNHWMKVDLGPNLCTCLEFEGIHKKRGKNYNIYNIKSVFVKYAPNRFISNIPTPSKIFFPLKYQVFKLDSYVQLVALFNHWMEVDLGDVGRWWYT